MRVTIEAEIRNGLAVTASADYHPGESAVYHGPRMAPEEPESVDYPEVRTVAAPHFLQPLSREDEGRIEEALIQEGADALRDEWERAGEARFDQIRDDCMTEEYR